MAAERLWETLHDGLTSENPSNELGTNSLAMGSTGPKQLVLMPNSMVRKMVTGVSDIADMNATRRRKSFRSTGQTAIGVVFSLGMIVVMIAKARHVPTGIAWWTAIGFFAILAVRLALVSVTANSEGVCIRGFVRTRRLGWSEIDHFSLGRLGLFPAVGIAYRKQGRPIAMTAIELAKVTTRKERAITQGMIDELNQMLAEQQAGGDPRVLT